MIPNERISVTISKNDYDALIATVEKQSADIALLYSAEVQDMAMYAWDKMAALLKQDFELNHRAATKLSEWMQTSREATKEMVSRRFKK